MQQGMNAYYYIPQPQQPSMMGYEDLANPAGAVHRMIKARSSMRGFGTTQPVPANGDAGMAAAGAGLGLGVIAAVVALSVAANYQLGKAMTPPGASEASWAWGAGIGGTLIPGFPIAMAVYKNYIR